MNKDRHPPAKVPEVRRPQPTMKIQAPRLPGARSRQHHQILAIRRMVPVIRRPEPEWTELLSSTRLLTTETASEGTSFVPLAENQPTALVIIPNFTSTTLEIRQYGFAYFVPPGAVHAFGGLGNANELELRRADCEDDPVTLLWAAELSNPKQNQ
jgi:hypothetical protein